MRLQIGNQVIDLSFSGGTFKPIALIVLVVLLAFAGFKSFYQVEQDEQAVVTRFGKWQKTVDPGLHFLIPFVDKYQKVSVQRQQNMQFGFSNISNQKFRSSRTYQSLLEKEKSMVTGDLNAAQVEWVIQYRITDPKAYLFNVRNPDETLRDASESVMREVVGDRTVDEVITIGRQEMESLCEAKLGELVDAYQLGITINQVQLNNVEPPVEVKTSFDKVNQAQQQKEEAINVAQGEYNREVPKARGDADRVISEANGYASKRINEAEGDAAKFNALFTEYQKSPDVTRRRIYLETMERVMPKLGKKVVIDEGANQVLPLLPLQSLGQ